MASTTGPSLVVLRNKGVSLKLAKVEQYVEAKGDEIVTRWRKILGKNGMPTTEEVWMRFDCNTVAEVEQRFGSNVKFEIASQQTPTSAVRELIAIVLEISPLEAGTRMLESEVADYHASLSAAWAMAQGVDPTQAIAMMETGKAVAKQNMARAETELVRLVADAREQLESHGTIGSSPGAVSDEAMRSSGA